MAGDREAGAALRAAREQVGLTLASVARHVPCTVSHLSNMESGRRTIHPHVPLAYERAAREADVNRRGMLTGLAASLIAPVAAAGLIRSGFEAALKGQQVSTDEWMERVEEYGRDYMNRGATAVQGRLTGDLVVLTQGLDMPRMWAIAARSLAIYGKTTSGPTEAIRWYQQATEAAQRSGDVDTQTWVAGRAALALGYEGAEPKIAAAYARQALALSDKPSSGRLNALMGKAHVLAQSGQRSAARSTWAQALKVFDELDPDDSITDVNYPYWRLGVVGSLLYSRLGDPRAEHWQQESERERPESMVRFATHLELHRGLMMSREGDRAGGVEYAQAALDNLPAERRSQSLLLMMDEIRGQ